MAAVIDVINSFIWGYVLVYGLVAVGIFFTLRLGFIQFVHFGEFFRVLKGGGETDERGISPIQALMVSLASRVGTGNIVGVAVALSLGGPGAIFWMWLVALVGMATAYAESTLGQLYKVENGNGEYRGGPAFYITRGLKLRWAGLIFSIFLIVSFGLVFNAVQANSIAEATEAAFGIPKMWVGTVVAILSGIIIFGGIRKVARAAQFIVPAMAALYLLLALIVVAMNVTEVPGIVVSIFAHAFGLEQAVGGFTGGLMAAMLNGVQRGLFSNEAGMGSVPNIAAAATPHPHHPSSQGFVQALGVFIDTIVICTCTAVIILLSDVYSGGGEVRGATLTQDAFSEQFGVFGVYFVAIAIFFFAFTSILGNYAYAENALTFLGLDGRMGLIVLRTALLAMVLWGSYESVATVFETADASMGLMATINLIAILALSGTVAKLTKDYFAQRKAGKSPRFEVEDYPELQGKISQDIWK